MDAYQRFQLETYGNILPDTTLTPEEELEYWYQEMTRLAEWIEQQNELS